MHWAETMVSIRILIINMIWQHCSQPLASSRVHSHFSQLHTHAHTQVRAWTCNSLSALKHSPSLRKTKRLNGHIYTHSHTSTIYNAYVRCWYTHTHMLSALLVVEVVAFRTLSGWPTVHIHPIATTYYNETYTERKASSPAPRCAMKSCPQSLD